MINHLVNDAVIKEARKALEVQKRHVFFLGIQDSNSQNNWQYISNKIKISWTNWEPGEPNNYQEEITDCVSTFWNNTYTWDDFPCSAKLVSICEMTTEGILLTIVCIFSIHFLKLEHLKLLFSTTSTQRN